MQVPTCLDRLVLIRLQDHRCSYELSCLLVRLSGSSWVVADTDGLLSIDDLANEEVVPLTPG